MAIKPSRRVFIDREDPDPDDVNYDDSGVRLHAAVPVSARAASVARNAPRQLTLQEALALLAQSQGGAPAAPVPPLPQASTNILASLLPMLLPILLQWVMAEIAKAGQPSTPGVPTPPAPPTPPQPPVLEPGEPPMPPDVPLRQFSGSMESDFRNWQAGAPGKVVPQSDAALAEIESGRDGLNTSQKNKIAINLTPRFTDGSKLHKDQEENELLLRADGYPAAKHIITFDGRQRVWGDDDYDLPVEISRDYANYGMGPVLVLPPLNDGNGPHTIQYRCEVSTANGYLLKSDPLPTLRCGRKP